MTPECFALFDVSTGRYLDDTNRLDDSERFGAVEADSIAAQLGLEIVPVFPANLSRGKWER